MKRKKYGKYRINIGVIVEHTRALFTIVIQNQHVRDGCVFLRSLGLELLLQLPLAEGSVVKTVAVRVKGNEIAGVDIHLALGQGIAMGPLTSKC